MNNNPNGNATGQGPPQPGGGSSMQMSNPSMVNPNSQGGNPNATNPSASGGIIPPTGSSWAQAAGKSLQASGGGGGVASGGGNSSTNSMNNPNQPGNSSVGSNPGNAGPVQPPSTSSVTSKQIEQLNSMREALFSHDGWGGVSDFGSWCNFQFRTRLGRANR